MKDFRNKVVVITDTDFVTPDPKLASLKGRAVSLFHRFGASPDRVAKDVLAAVRKQRPLRLKNPSVGLYQAVARKLTAMAVPR
jgi:hypothetical protein